MGWLAAVLIGSALFAAIGAWAESGDRDLSWDDYWKHV